MRITLQADALHTRAQAARIEAFTTCLSTLAERREDARDLARAQIAHLLGELNAAASTKIEASAARLLGGLETRLTGDGAALTAGQLEARGEQIVLDGATRVAEAWRREHAAALAVAFQMLTERLADGFARDLESVRGAARDLLGVRLSLAATDIRLAGDPRFHYAPPDPQSPTGVLAAAVRARLPGQAGRRRIERRLREAVPETVDRQVGRARASVHQRLTETRTALLAALSERYDQYASGLTAALEAAEQLGALGAVEAELHRARLHEREDRLTTLIRAAEDLDRRRSTPLTQAR